MRNYQQMYNITQKVSELGTPMATTSATAALFPKLSFLKRPGRQIAVVVLDSQTTGVVQIETRILPSSGGGGKSYALDQTLGSIVELTQMSQTLAWDSNAA